MCNRERKSGKENAGEMHGAVKKNAMRINKNKCSCQLLARTGNKESAARKE